MRRRLTLTLVNQPSDLGGNDSFQRTLFFSWERCLRGNGCV